VPVADHGGHQCYYPVVGRLVELGEVVVAYRHTLNTPERRPGTSPPDND
jgi:hypothetical protein